MRLAHGCAALLVVAATAAQAAADAASVPASGATSVATSGAASAIPYLAERASTGDLSLRTGAALLLCLLVGAAAVYLLKRGKGGALIGSAAGGRHVDVVETRALGPKSRLVVVRYDDQQLLLAHTDAGVTLLHQKPAAAAGLAP